MNRGEVIYQDFMGYPPLRYYIYWFFMYCGDFNVQSVRIGIAVLTALFPVLAYWISLQMMPPLLSLLPALAVLVAPSCYYSRWLTLNLLCITAALIYYINRKSKPALLVLSLTTSLSLLLRYTPGAFALFLSVVLIIFINLRKNREKKLKALLSSLSFFLLITLLIGIGGNLLMLSQVEWDFVGGYISKVLFHTRSVWSNPFPPFWVSLREIFNDPLYFNEALWFKIPFVVLGLAGIWLCRNFMRKNFSDEVIKTAVLLTVSCFGLGIIYYRAGYGNLIRVLPLIMILYAFIIHKIKEMKNKAGRFRKAALLIAALPYVYFMVITCLYDDETVGSPGEIRYRHRQLNLDKAKVMAPESIAWLVEDLVYYINENTEEDDEIFAVPMFPFLYFLTGRTNPSTFEWILPKHPDEKTIKNVVLEELQRNPPQLIIYSEIAIDGREDRRLRNYAKNLHRFIYENYVFKYAFEEYWVLELKERSYADLCTECFVGMNCEQQGIGGFRFLYRDQEIHRCFYSVGSGKWTFPLQNSREGLFSVSAVLAEDKSSHLFIRYTGESGQSSVLKDFEVSTLDQWYNDSDSKIYMRIPSGKGSLELALETKENIVYWIEPVIENVK